MGTTTTRRQIDDFWALKRLAVVGVSRDPKHFSNVIWQELRQRRYEAVPVNPNATELDGQRCYARIQDIEPPVEGVVVMTPSAVSAQVVRDADAAGVRHVWLHKGAGGGSGAVSEDALEYCRTHGIDVVAGFCPYMFLPGTPFFHGFHAFAKKLTGSYPR
ncbi:MAG TPA: CoA-binding protein [Candidatus Dormibacteraeota bacterium]|nr:CoA-binding protein [Candidatus Dormibacteraeota bacterium]